LWRLEAIEVDSISLDHHEDDEVARDNGLDYFAATFTSVKVRG
jgi:hypothetical protein